MFDEKSIQQLEAYVYLLISPADNLPFYVGKGNGNRVFNHINLALETSTESDKYDEIRKIQASGNKVSHVILRHGLTDKQAYAIEASAIDLLDFLSIKTTNLTGGHNSMEKGLMTSDEIIRLYNAEKLDFITTDCMIVNINRRYKRGSSEDAIYNASKGIWTTNKHIVKDIKYVLSEYRGLIVEIFEVKKWFEAERGYNSNAKKFGQTRIGMAFDGVIAPSEIRVKYINKSIAHTKKRGASMPFRFSI